MPAIPPQFERAAYRLLKSPNTRYFATAAYATPLGTNQVAGLLVARLMELTPGRIREHSIGLPMRISELDPGRPTATNASRVERVIGCP